MRGEGRGENEVNLLAFDTSTNNLSLSLFYGGRLIADHNEQARFGSSKLIACIERYMKKSRLALDDFDALVVGSGPGSFTGLRIAFSVAKGFGVARGIPVVRVGSFHASAYAFKERHDRIAVIGDARKGLVYAASFVVKKGTLAAIGETRLCDLAGFVRGKEGHFFITSDTHLIPELKKINERAVFCPEPVFPAARDLVCLGKDLFCRGKFTPLDKLEPQYLHSQTCQIRAVPPVFRKTV
jgi:tRNA threonylcarbamoyladenosine biosynthesis protein TsaB